MSSLSATGDQLDDADRVALDRMLSGTHLGEHIVGAQDLGAQWPHRLRQRRSVCGRDHIYDGAGLASAFSGEVRSRIVEKAELESVLGISRWSRLIETYSPLRADGDRTVLAVAGFFNGAETLEQSVRAAQLRSWGVHGAITLAMFVLLATLVSKANDTIAATQRELKEKVAQLTALLAQNEQLHDRMNRAAARTMTLNEQFLRNIATDLHDGPGQGLALASMRIEALGDVCGNCEHSIGRAGSVSEEFRTVHLALQSALTDLRAILRGLQLPEIEQLSLVETLQRAAADHQRKTGVAVPLTLNNAPDQPRCR